jgi:predicted MFS family arabinose efflux permease
VVIERRSAAPLVRLGIFKVRSLTGANLSMLAVAGGMFSVFYFASIYLQQTLGFTPVQTGLAFLPLTAGIILFSGIAQQLIGRVGVREIGMTGMGLAAIGLLLLSRAPVDGTYVADVLPGILVMSAGLGLTFVPLTLIATTGLADDDAGLASGIFNSSQQIGGALGLAILSTVAASQTTDALESAGANPSQADQASALVEGFQAAFAIGAGLMLLGVIIAALLIRRRDVAMVQSTESVHAGV